MTDWTAKAACRALPADESHRLFFSGRGSLEGRLYCAACPVRVACLAEADELEGNRPIGYLVGIWGGLSPAERKERRRLHHELAGTVVISSGRVVQR